MKHTCKILSLVILCTVLLLVSFTGCGKKELGNEYSTLLNDTVWEYSGDYYAFQADGTVLTYNAQGELYEGFEGAFRWLDDSGRLVYGAATYVLTLDDEHLIATGDEGDTFAFTRVAEVPAAAAGPITPEQAQEEEAAKAQNVIPGEGEDMLDLRNSSWETEGVVYHFYADGSVDADNGSTTMKGSYTWNGKSGTITIDDISAPISKQADGLYLEGTDGYYYTLVPVEDNAF